MEVSPYQEFSTSDFFNPEKSPHPCISHNFKLSPVYPDQSENSKCRGLCDQDRNQDNSSPWSGHSPVTSLAQDMGANLLIDTRYVLRRSGLRARDPGPHQKTNKRDASRSFTRIYASFSRIYAGEIFCKYILIFFIFILHIVRFPRPDAYY